MQIIDELEPVRRGPYCGSILHLGDDGSILASVAIRTALISAGSEPGQSILDYSVGAGIVADSDPETEWRETITKAGILAALDPRGTPARLA
jgi:para-aminobenzoate synthetase component 1